MGSEIQAAALLTLSQIFVTNIQLSILSKYLGKMTKLGKIHAKAAQKASKKVIRKRVKSRMVRGLEKSRPRRFMNQFLCFAHEERMKAKNGRLLSDWKAAHKGLGGKWRALGAGRAKFHKSGKVPAFALYVKESPKHKEFLPAWRNAHKGLGARWKALDKASKGKYVAASKEWPVNMSS